MTITDFLEKIQHDGDYRGQLAHVETIPARQAVYGELSRPLPGPVVRALAAAGIERLYSHQVEAVDAVRAGRNVVVVTGTASGNPAIVDDACGCMNTWPADRSDTAPGATAFTYTSALRLTGVTKSP